MGNSQDDPPLDTREAAEYLGLKPNTLEIWRSTGRYALPYEKLGRYIKYRKSALDTFRTERTFVSTAGAKPVGKGAE